MTDKKTIFSTGAITYDKEWYIKNGLDVKPVVYTEQFLKNIAETTDGSSIELSHGNQTNDTIGYANKFDFIDDKLVANILTDEQLEGKGFSPEFSVNFIDKGNSYEAIDGKLLKTILTENPRSHILCNSVEGGSNMNEELINTLNKQIKDLNREVAQKEAIIEANKKKLSEVTELTDKITELEKENNTYKSQIEDYKTQIDGLKPQAEAYGKIEETRKADLLTKAFGEDEEAKKAWADASMEQLESLANHREYTREAHGLGANNVPDQNDEPNDEPSEAEKAIAFYEKQHGEKPSFLKE